MRREIGDMVCGPTFVSGLLSLGGEVLIRLIPPARDYVEGMWLMLQQPEAEDFVLATGETHRVREFVNKSFNAVGIQLKCVSGPS